MRLAVLIIGLSLLSSPNIFADQKPTIENDRPAIDVHQQAYDHIIEIYYICASGRIDTTFRANGRKINALNDAFKGHRILAADVTGYTSPDGRLQFNRDLSYLRAKSFADMLQDGYDVPASEVTLHHTGIDWQGLRRMVSESDMENAADIIDIIDNVPELTTGPSGEWLDSRKKHLMDYNGGRDYNWMLDNIFPQLRRTYAIITIEGLPVEPEPIVEPAVEPEPVIEEPEPVFEPVFEPAPEPQPEPVPAPEIETTCISHHVFALRSNLLLPLLNVGAELPIGNRWSVGVDYYYPWSWRRSNNKNTFEIIFISADVRYWFGERTLYNRLKGHSVGAYGAWGYYDFERNYHGHQGHGYSIGVDYTYSLPVAKDKLHFEFQIGFGGIISPGAQPYNVYEVGGELIREHGVKKNFSYWGPTKIAISLVVPINKCVKQPVSEP